MSNHLRRIPSLLLASVVVLGVASLQACGSDDEDTSAGTETTRAASDDTGSSGTDSSGTDSTTDSGTTDDSGFPTTAFCDAVDDFNAAQDGAQRNTALGEMQTELTDDAPAEVSEAIDTLLTGDLEPSDYEAASQTLQSHCD